MSKADAAVVQARNAARARWGGQVVTRAAGVVVERAAELGDEQLLRLAHAAAEEAERRRAVARSEGRGAV